ncbi:hypothetical protein EV421DRAFT_1773041 [Armillaria borealis]|uniref:Uncharacterized protein n=1 Tax=Armillaria borealis TaxID=47425 RepID=A0AA39K1M1_9AGAR|nr:hypothetical protein EV421DRAFT_1773041 [Armillaria borealis]
MRSRRHRISVILLALSLLSLFFFGKIVTVGTHDKNSINTHPDDDRAEGPADVRVQYKASTNTSIQPGKCPCCHGFPSPQPPVSLLRTEVFMYR